MDTKQYAAAGPWISVEDALPEDETRALVKVVVDIGDISGTGWRGARYMGHGLWSCEIEGDGITVTHWAEVRA